jgi:hypothetical protein
MNHRDLPDAGLNDHRTIDRHLPTPSEKGKLEVIDGNAPIAVTGARGDPEAALASLLRALEALGLISDSTTAS